MGVSPPVVVWFASAFASNRACRHFCIFGPRHANTGVIDCFFVHTDGSAFPASRLVTDPISLFWHAKRSAVLPCVQAAFTLAPALINASAHSSAVWAWREIGAVVVSVRLLHLLQLFPCRWNIRVKAKMPDQNLPRLKAQAACKGCIALSVVLAIRILGWLNKRFKTSRYPSCAAKYRGVAPLLSWTLTWKAGGRIEVD